MDGAPNQDNQAYRVLARKYRPSTFQDLIGQEPMVQTLTNAFRLGRIAQAYMLTGVRGVGKTTTARILARALNYEGDGIDGPTIDMPQLGAHCEAIIKSGHIDVIEMDAASHTGIGDIREIIDAVKYKPATARYKVYIIDEVHMLSQAAFNGLLKTLEEPPEHVKFIFATTEIRKVPVTILSRCQRFDLRRIDAERMVAYLKDIAEKESVDVSEEALFMLARASEGSVRDALSLLDQAIAHGSGKVDQDEMRNMLGLADRARVIDLFEHVMAGRVAEALAEIRAQFDLGADPLVIMSDLAEFTHLVTVAKVSDGIPSNFAISNLERDRATAFAEALPVRVLSRAWQFLLKGIEEIQGANKPLHAADMVIVRLAYAADLPTPDEALRALRDNGGMPAGSPPPSTGATGMSTGHGGGHAIGQGAAPALRPDSAPLTDGEPVALQAGEMQATQRPRPVLATNNPAPQSVPMDDKAPDPVPLTKVQRFEDLIALAEEKRDLALRSAFINHVSLVAFEDGRIEFAPTESAPQGLAHNLKAALSEWTGRTWSVAVSREAGAPPLAEQWAEEERQRSRDAEEDPVVAEVLRRFPGSKIINVTYREETNGDAGLPPAPDEEDM
ncbi:MAG: DNA polymerase III subunit gamma/tau [Pseudomonadota bacterium]